MSGTGAPDADAFDARGLRIAVVATRWHERIIAALLAGATTAAADCRVRADDLTIARVPGVFELPVAAAALARTHQAVVCLGVVIRGGTPHFDYVCGAVSSGCTRVALDTGVPIGFGVLTCDTEDQALDRCGLPESGADKGREALLASVETALLLRGLREGTHRGG